MYYLIHKWIYEQLLLMKINFDTLAVRQDQRTSLAKSPFVQLIFQSPVYNSVTKDFQANNYKSQLENVNELIKIPFGASQFIQNQIHQQVFSLKQLTKVDEEVEEDNNNAEKPKNNSLNQTQKTYFSKSQRVVEKKQSQNNPKASKFGWVYSYKKHKCKDSHLPSEVRKTLQQMNEFTGHPTLVASQKLKKASNGRILDSYINNVSKHYTVYQSLYQEGKRRKMKEEFKMRDGKKIEERKPDINKSFFESTKKLYCPLLNRINSILDMKEEKRQEKQKLELQSGRQLFKLDLSGSRQSYQLYHRSLSRQKIVVQKKRAFEDRNYAIKDTQKMIKRGKEAKQNPIDSKVIEHLMDVFYSQAQQNPTFTHLFFDQKSLKRQQFFILQPFLNEVQELERKKFEISTVTSSTTKIAKNEKPEQVLSRQDFQAKLRKYYDKLNLYDRQVLRKGITHKQIHQFQKKVKQQQDFGNEFQPRICLRSSSLDNLQEGHMRKIYYI